MGRTSGTSFVDITDPANPIYLGNLPPHTSNSTSWRDIKVYSDHAYIVSEASLHGLQVFDLTQLRSVTNAAGRFQRDQRTTTGSAAPTTWRSTRTDRFRLRRRHRDLLGRAALSRPGRPGQPGLCGLPQRDDLHSRHPVRGLQRARHGPPGERGLLQLQRVNKLNIIDVTDKANSIADLPDPVQRCVLHPPGLAHRGSALLLARRRTGRAELRPQHPDPDLRRHRSGRAPTGRLLRRAVHVDRSQPLHPPGLRLRGELPRGAADPRSRRSRLRHVDRGGLLRHLPQQRQRQFQRRLERLPLLRQRHRRRQRDRAGSVHPAPGTRPGLRHLLLRRQLFRLRPRNRRDHDRPGRSQRLQRVGFAERQRLAAWSHGGLQPQSRLRARIERPDADDRRGARRQLQRNDHRRRRGRRPTTRQSNSG